MSNATSVPKHGTTPPLIHLCDRGRSTRTHHRALDGTYHRIEKSLTCVIDLGEAQRAYADNTGFHLCTECVEARSARARAKRTKEELDRKLRDLDSLRNNLAYELTYMLRKDPDADLSEVISDLMEVDAQERTALEQRKAHEEAGQ